MSHTPKNRSAAETVTMTRADLEALADKFVGHDRCQVSKPEALNMIATAVLGPKHDWSWIKKSETPVVSQRAASLASAEQEAPQELHALLFDAETEDHIPAVAKIIPDGIEVRIADGTIVWIERNSGIQKVHVYNDTSDGPISVRSEPMCRMVVLDDAYLGDMPAEMRSRDLSGTNEKPIVGYQVADTHTGEHWDDRPSFDILSLDVALKDFQDAQAAEKDIYQILTIREGDVEEPRLITA